MMNNDILIILFGILIIAFHKSIVKQQDSVNRHVFRVKSSPTDIKQSQIIGLLIGLAVVIFGTLSLLNVL